MHETLLERERVVKKCFASGATKMSSHELVTSTYLESFQFAAHPHCVSLTYVLTIMSSSILRLGLPGYLLHVGFVVKMLIHLLYAPCIPRALMIRIMFCEAKQNLYVVFPICLLFPSSDHLILTLCSQTHSVPVFRLDTSCTPM